MEKINLVELLKDCPEGMELDCTMFDDVKFIGVEKYDKPICIRAGDVYRYLTKYGTWVFDEKAKCVIFPKGKTTWEGFIPPCKFKDGDIVATTLGSWIGITTGGDNERFLPVYCAIGNGEFEIHLEELKFDRLATEEEKQKLFKAIKDNGYKWDDKNKTLEKLVPNKFDITTLKPFKSKVLVRDSENEKWRPAIWGFYDSDSECVYPYKTVGGYSFSQCIPYNCNENLLGKKDYCDVFYKNWK